jgi:predicted metalloprotease
MKIPRSTECIALRMTTFLLAALGIGIFVSTTTLAESPNDDVTTDADKDFVARVMGSTERIWDGIFKNMGQQYQKPTLVLFGGFVQSACGMAQSATDRFIVHSTRKSTST